METVQILSSLVVMLQGLLLILLQAFIRGTARR